MMQGTEEWHQARLGKVTASRIWDIIDRTQNGGYRKSRENYMNELLEERKTGKRRVLETNFHMQRGIDNEPIARMLYEVETGADVELVGFIDHPQIGWSGASPDGIVGGDGLLEIKCPTLNNHLVQIFEVPKKYLAQMYWQLACTKKKWCDFVSYCTDLKLIHVERVYSDEKKQNYIESEISKFLEELAQFK